MKNILLFSVFIFFAAKSFSQQHKERCNIKVDKAEPVVVNDKLFYYKVVLTNSNNKAIDACEWKASFYDKFEKLIGESTGNWSTASGIIKDDPVQPGEKITDRETPKDIGAADKIVISIKKVHFIDGTSCQ